MAPIIFEFGGEERHKMSKTKYCVAADRARIYLLDKCSIARIHLTEGAGAKAILGKKGFDLRQYVVVIHQPLRPWRPAA